MNDFKWIPIQPSQKSANDTLQKKRWKEVKQKDEHSDDNSV